MAKKEYSFVEPAVGCDAEGFLKVAGGTNNVPVVGLLGGTKGRPIACDGGGFLEDCVAWEINPEPVPVSLGPAVFVENVTKCLDEVRRRAALLDLEVNIKPAVLFKKADLSSPQASVSGCSTSYCAWDLRRHEAVDLSITNYRFASGDLHISWPNIDDVKEPYKRINLIRALDIWIGMAEILTQSQTKRTQFYGKPGVHRPTPYGVEYKTPSNFWLNDARSMEWAYKACLSALKYVSQLDNTRPEFENNKKDILACFAQWDKSKAKAYMSHYGAVRFPSL